MSSLDAARINNQAKLRWIVVQTIGTCGYIAFSAWVR